MVVLNGDDVMTRLTSRRTWLEHSCRSQVQLPRLPLWSSNGAAGNQHDDSYGGGDDISDYDGEDPLVNLHAGWCTWSAGLWSLASHTSYAEKATIIQHGNGWHEYHQWQEYQHQHRNIMITTFTMHHHQLAHLWKELVPCDHESVHVRHASPWRQDGVSIIEPGLPITSF